MKTIKSTQQYVDTVEANKNVTAVLFTQADSNCARCNQAKHTIKNLKVSVPVFDMPTVMDQYPANILGIKTVPTLVIFKNGFEVSRLSGTSPELYKKEYQSVLHNNY